MIERLDPHEALALTLQDKITAGAIPLGAKLPTAAQTAAWHHMSETTAQTAYRRLAAQGLAVMIVAGRGRRDQGYYVVPRNPDTPGWPQPITFDQVAAYGADRSRRARALGRPNPWHKTLERLGYVWCRPCDTYHPPYPPHQHIVEEVARLIRAGLISPGQRLPRLRLVKRYRVRLRAISDVFSTLAAAGYIEGAARRGYHAIRPPATVGLPGCTRPPIKLHPPLDPTTRRTVMTPNSSSPATPHGRQP